MNLVENNRKIVVFAILEGSEAYTEINFFNGFIKSIEYKYKKIIFIPPFAIDGNIKNSKEFIDNFFNKLKSYIESSTEEKFNSFNDIYIFCIWDKLEQKTNFQNNYNLLEKDIKNNKNIIYKFLRFEESIEKDLFSKFFGRKLLLINNLVQKLGYKKIKDIKSKTNKHLFWNIMEKAKINVNSNILINIKEKLSNNGEINFVKILNFIEKLNNY